CAKQPGRQGIAYGSGRADNIAGQHSAVLLPVVGVVKATDKKVRVAGQNVNVLAGLLLKLQQVVVDPASTFHAGRKVAHAVAKGDTIGQGGMHSQHHRLHFLALGGTPNHAFEPLQLRSVKVVTIDSG